MSFSFSLLPFPYFRTQECQEISDKKENLIFIDKKERFIMRDYLKLGACLKT